ncbi:hypothetical protein niasHT_031753 [Heterodera trifolii]|uniref:Effector protein n=1 Tax=Heterodera trifolii TaxID=157864 RepID=A0ABD2IGY8_9BILA
MTTDERNIQCVDYEDEEDLIMEDHLSTYYKAENKWPKMYETMRRDENELEKTDMTSQSQKTLKIKAYCTGHRSNPVPVYEDVQRRLDACKQLGNVYWGVETIPGVFCFYYKFKYERKAEQNGIEFTNHKDEKDKELEKHLLFYHKNGKDEQLAILLRSYHNLKKELEKREKNFAQVNSLNDLGAMSRTYDNMDNGLAGQKQYEQ